MNRTVAAIVLSAFVLVGVLPRKTDAGILEGALIGAAVGAVVGLIAEASKPKTTDVKPKSEPAPQDSVIRADSTPVFR